MAAPERTPLKGLIGGALTGSLEICATYPIKYVKTQLQLELKSGADRKYTGIVDCMRKTIKNHGVFGLYRGLNVFMYAPKSAIRFGGFELMRSKLMDEQGRLSSYNKFICGLCAGAVEAVIVNTPLETVEVKLIHDMHSAKPQFKGFFHGARTIIKTEGFRGIYQGVYPSVIKQSSNQGIRFFVLETLRSIYQNDDPKVAVPTIVIGLFGFVAGFCSVMGNNPIDVVKTRMQGLEAAQYKHFGDCFIQIWRKEGFLSFYRGVTPRLTRVCLEVALTFAIYDSILGLFRALPSNSDEPNN